MLKYLKEHPGDAESLYGLTVAYAQKQDIAKAVGYLKQAIDAGLPFARFVAGPRDLLKPFTGSEEFKALAKKYGSTLIHGPMLGCMTQSSVKFRARTANELPIQVLVSQSEDMQSPIKSETARTDKAQDYTAIVSIEGLKPDTRYYYQLLIDGGEQGGPASFRTFPKKGSKARFQIGFRGGAGYTPQHEKM